MVELDNRYQIGKRRFKAVNWVGFQTLLWKEILRYLTVSTQTIMGPILSSGLFLIVISLAIGDLRADVLGVPFIEFLAPGMIALGVVQQSFAHSSSSIIMGKMMQTLQDLLQAPLSAAEITIAISVAAASRGICIAIISSIIFMFFIDLTIQNYFIWLFYLFIGGFFLGSLGIIIGLKCEKFDEMSSYNSFLIVPASFLSGSWYSIERLPDFLKTINYYNPCFYFIDGFRYSFIGQSDGSIKFGIIFLLIISFITWYISYLLFRRGYKIKS